MLAFAPRPGNGLIVASGRRQADGTSIALTARRPDRDTSRPMVPRIALAGLHRVDELWLQRCRVRAAES
jgi:hypothetical protein